MVAPPICESKLVSMQNVYPSASTVVSSDLDSSRAKDNLGPRQPPRAKKTRMVLFSFVAKKASSSFLAFSDNLIILFSSNALCVNVCIIKIGCKYGFVNVGILIIPDMEFNFPMIKHGFNHVIFF